MKICQYMLILMATLLLVQSGCKKDGEIFTVASGSFPPAALTASATSIQLSAASDKDTAIRFKWPAVDYGKNTVVSYTLDLTIPSDTSGANGWSKAKSFPVDNGVLQYNFLGKDLNNLLGTMGFLPDVEGPLVARIRSDVNQYNGAASSIQTAYSNLVTLHVTPFGLNLYVPGDYQGWNPATAPVISPVPGKATMFEGYVYIKGVGMQYFKYTNAPDFDHINYGDGGNGTFSTDGNAAGLFVPSGGYYELTADLSGNTWTATATTWSMLGDATPGGWNTDTQLIYDETTQQWKATAYLLKNGSFKFRANNNWVIDFGLDGDGQLAYADNPFFGYNPNVANITVPEDGTYAIVLDLHVSGKYSYSLTKK